MKRTLAIPKPCVSSRAFRRRDEVGVVGQAEVIIRAQIDHAPAVRDRDLGVLRAGDDALGFEKTLRLDVVESLGNVVGNFASIAQFRAALAGCRRGGF